jgi:diguanylate cyclase (GGDEF)-like protein
MVEGKMEKELNPASPCKSSQSTTHQIRTTMREIERRQWWLCSTGVAVAVLLALGVASFSLPGLRSQQVGSELYQLNLDLAARGLVALVLLFGIYVVYQQLQIHRIDDTVVVALNKIQERTAQVYKLAGRDHLTDLYNREFGERRLSEEMSRAKRFAKPLAVLRLNLIGLEKISEGLGTASADCAIRLFAGHLQRELRLIDVPIRLDRGEFLILLPECKATEAEAVFARLNRMTVEFGEQQQTELVAGWADFVEGDASPALVMKAESTLHANMKNGSGPTQAVKISLPGNTKKSDNGAAFAQLRARERQVFELLARGKTNKEVANSLGISLRTAESYRASIMLQLDVHSASELVFYAVRNKIIDVE